MMLVLHCSKALMSVTEDTAWMLVDKHMFSYNILLGTSANAFSCSHCTNALYFTLDVHTMIIYTLRTSPPSPSQDLTQVNSVPGVSALLRSDSNPLVWYSLELRRLSS